MALIASFKKDYFNYLLSIILPAFVSGIAVPVLKNILGAEGYGEFSIYLNATLICTAIITGWITQSIYRFYPSAQNKNLFAQLSISISMRTQLLFYAPIIFVVWYIKNDVFLGLLICLSVFTNSMQFLYMSISQSSFLSKKIIYSETIRSLSYILMAIFFLLLVPGQYLYILFIAIILSYSLSIFYLRVQTRHFFLKNSIKNDKELSYKNMARKFFKYGSPLSLWIVFAYLIPYIDKLMILHNLGAKVQGNYQAVFDLLYRGLTVLISPVIISLLPLLSKEFEKSQIKEIRKLMKKIILFELAGFVLTSIIYWWFGATLLFIILKVPDTTTFRITGFLILAGTFIWQLAMVIHQRYILRFRSLLLLYMIAVAFLVELIFFVVVANSSNPLVYPLGFLIAATIYLLLVSFSQLVIIAKPLGLRLKAIIN